MRTAFLVMLVVSWIASGATGAEPAGPREKPWWAGSRAGVGDEVLAPWTPVEVSGGKVSVWGRTYEFAGLPLPAAVGTGGTGLLAGPVTLRGAAGGKELAWTAGPCRTLEARPGAVRLACQAESETLRCEGIATVEYDGMVRCDLTLAPRAGKATIERLALEIALSPEHAKYLHFWPGRWGSVFNSAALPKDGFRGDFRPFVWLGDEDRGLGWFCESDRNFFHAAGEKPVEIVRADKSVILRVHLVTKAQTIEGPLEYTFGFQATPVKPLAPDAWDYRIVHMGRYGMDDAALDRLVQAGVRTMCFHEQWTDIQAYPATTHGEQLKKLAAACRKRNLRLLLYLGYEMSTIAPEWADHHEECLVDPRAGGYKRTYQPEPDQTAYIVCYRSAWQDFIAAHLEKLLAEYDLGGVYLDGTSEPWGCRNARHGCGYRRPDGSLGTTYPVYDTRSMMKRIYTLVRKHDPEGQVNVHQSTCMVIPTLSFATSYWDGEQLQSLKRQSTAGDVLPLDAFRCEFMGRNWGVPAELLHYASGPLRRSESMALALLHDVPVRPGSLEDLDELARLWRAFDEFGRRGAEWTPYWNAGKRAAPSSPDVKVSLYNRPGKGLIAVVANTGPKECKAEVTLDLAALEQPGPLAARDVLTGREVRFSDGRLALALESLGFAVVRVGPETSGHPRP